MGHHARLRLISQPLYWPNLGMGRFGAKVEMDSSGQIAAFNPVNGRFIGLMSKSDNSILSIDRLWGAQARRSVLHIASAC
jgi:hypothetical protein